MVDQKDVEIKALSVVEQANGIVITDNASYLNAGAFFKSIDKMIKEINDTFNPICEAAFRAHKEATSRRAGFLDPLMSAKKSVKKLMSDWDAEQERIRRKEEARLAEIVRKQEEERKLQEAIEAEANGDIEGAENIMNEEVYIPPVVIPKSVPKISGGPVFKEIWKFRIVNEKLIPREYLIPDEKKLVQLARALKKQFSVPGVEAYSKRV